MKYTLVHFPPLDRHSTVAFRLPSPQNAHEAMLTLTLSRGSWESQDSPETITITMSADTGDPT
ncbi:hypothetical protein [Longimicrobium sp.]|jgi:hypothetical protein|uniref:hypothetical protein n=1 Tax=Longimicrobium sp. TaxID=2029185 RepID=UPI002ED91A47